MAYDDQNLDDLIAQKAAEGEADLSPIQGYGHPAAAAPAGQWALTPDRKSALYEKVYNEAMGNEPKSPEEASVLQRLATASRRQMPGNSPFSGLGSALAGASKMKADVLLSNPYTSTQNKLDAAGRAGTGAMLGSVLNNLVDKKRNDAMDQLNADTKTAAMFRSLHPKGGATTSLGVINAAQRDDLMAQNQAKYDAKVAAAQANADPESDVSKATREAMLKTGIWEPGELDGMSHDQMMQARVAKMQTARFDAQGREHDRTMNNEDVLKARRDEESRIASAAEEQRKETRRAEQANIPGVVWGGGKVPDERAVNAVRDLAPAHKALVDDNKRLAEIQRELETAHGIVGGAAGAVEQYLGPERAKALLDEAMLIQQNQTDLLRNMKKFGVPQEYELKLLANMNPTPGTITGFFKGPAQWEEASKFYDKELRNKLKANNAFLPDDAELYNENGSPNFSQQDPASLVPKFQRGEFQPYQARGAQPAGDVPAVSEKLPTGPLAPVAQPEKATNVPSGSYFVKMSSGWTKNPRQLTAEQAANLVNQGLELKAAQ